MVKVITIRDDVYKRLKSLKRTLDLSFSETLDFLLNLYDSRGQLAKIRNLRGSIRSINKRRLSEIL